MDNIELRIEREFADDRDSSASVLTMNAIHLLKDLALASRGSASAGRVSDLGQRIAATKPSMAGLGNAARRFARMLEGLKPNPSALEITGLAELFLRDLANTAHRATANSSRMVPATSTVATCSYSSLALRTLERAHPTTVLVYVPPGEYEDHGMRMATALAARGKTVEIVQEPLRDRHFQKLSMAIVGADAVTAAFVVNGSPSLELATSIDGRAPFYVVSERIKFAHEVEVQPGFDRVPIELVAGIITEDGVIAPRTLDRWINTGR